MGCAREARGWGAKTPAVRRTGVANGATPPAHRYIPKRRHSRTRTESLDKGSRERTNGLGLCVERAQPLERLCIVRGGARDLFTGYAPRAGFKAVHPRAHTRGLFKDSA